MAYVDRPLPATGLAGKFSFQYCAAVAVLDGAVSKQALMIAYIDVFRFMAFMALSMLLLLPILRPARRAQPEAPPTRERAAPMPMSE
jgi:hypothetical protein